MFEPEDFQGDVLPVIFSVNHARWPVFYGSIVFTGTRREVRRQKEKKNSARTSSANRLSKGKSL